MALTAAVLAGALLATSASAALPEFRAESYTVVEKAANTNIHGFSIAAGAVVIICKKASFNTGEEGALNPTKESETVTLHPRYEECFISIGAGNSSATVNTEGCNYTLRAKAPGTSGGEVKVVCAAGKEITVTDNTIPACKTKVGSQTLKGIEYVDEPGLPAFGEVLLNVELEKIKWKAEGCGTAASGEDGAYRQGELVGPVATLSAKGHPAKVKMKGETEAKAEDKVVVSGAESGQTGTAHYYKNGISLSALLPEKEKLAVMSWGTLSLKSEAPSTAAPTTCETGAGGFVENPGGVNGPAGKGQTSDFATWNCAQAECPTGAEIEFPSGSGKFVKLEFIVFPGPELISPRAADVTEKSKVIKAIGAGLGKVHLGDQVTGTKIPAGAKVISVISASEVEISSAVEGAGIASVVEEVKFKDTVANGSLPWPSELTEPEAKKIRTESKEVTVILGCAAQKSVEGGPPLGDGDADSPQFLAEPTLCATIPEANKQEPLDENGTQIGGPVTSKVTFDEKSGELFCEGPNSEKPPKTIQFEAKTEGKLHVFTYEGQELVDTH